MNRSQLFRFAPFAFPVMCGLGVAIGCQVSFESVCGDQDRCAGPMGGEGSKESSGGRSSEPSDGGNGGQGGVPALPGGIGGSGVAGEEGLGGEAPSVGSGGQQISIPSTPVLTQVLVGNEELESGETLLGLGDGPEIVLRFSEPMDKKSVQKAYHSPNVGTDAAHVAFTWNDAADELRVVPLTKLRHAEVTEPDAVSELFTFSIEKGVKSRAGVEMKKAFEGSFRLKKRVTYFVIPDMRRSLWKTSGGGPAEAMISEEGLYPDHQGFYCPVFVSQTQPAEAGSLLLGYEVINPSAIYPTAYQSYISLDVNEPDARSVGVYAFPLPQNIEAIEDASLKAVKWYGTVGNASEGKLDLADFSVDVLASDDDGVQDWADALLAVDLANTDGNDTSYGYGPFEFDVTDIVADGVEREDKWSAYRLGFEEIVSAESPIFACAAASLTIVYWAL